MSFTVITSGSHVMTVCVSFSYMLIVRIVFCLENCPRTIDLAKVSVMWVTIPSTYLYDLPYLSLVSEVFLSVPLFSLLP